MNSPSCRSHDAAPICCRGATAASRIVIHAKIVSHLVGNGSSNTNGIIRVVLCEVKEANQHLPVPVLCTSGSMGWGELLICTCGKYLLKVFLPLSRWVENFTGNIFSLGFRRHVSYVFTAGKKLYIGYWQLLTMFTPPDWKSEHMAITGAKPTVVPLKGTPLKSTQKENEMALRHWRRQAEKSPCSAQLLTQCQGDTLSL